MAKTGLQFTAKASDYEEKVDGAMSPERLVRKLSQGKARAVAVKHRNAIIIAADTIAVLGGKVLGKPKNKADARQTLQSLSGKANFSVTGLTVIDTATDKEVTKVIKTKIFFQQLSVHEINAYIASGEPFGKAAAYALQGLGSVIVRRIEGDPFNIMGLPLAALAQMLKKFGVHVL